MYLKYKHIWLSVDTRLNYSLKIYHQEIDLKKLLENWADLIACRAPRYFKLKPSLNMIPKGGKVTQKAGVSGNSGVQWGRAEALQSDRSGFESLLCYLLVTNLWGNCST